MSDVDTVVIGSGAGGLAAALCLAQGGDRVAVFEQHYVPGGWCHSFQLGGHRYSPGVHYIGGLGPGGRTRAIYEGLGVAGDLTFLELNPDGYEHVQLGDAARFDFPRGRDALLARLKARFPRDSAGLDGYFALVDRVTAQLGEIERTRRFVDFLTVPFRTRHLGRFGLQSLGRVLDRFVGDPALRSLLSVQCGDHGLPPSRAPFVVHASVAAHYYDGGAYPLGGGSAIPQAFAHALRRAGGQLHLRAAVDRVLVEGRGSARRALGVRLADGTEVRARRVVSNADPGVTYGRLVGGEHLSGRLQRKLARTRWSPAVLSLFLAVDMDLAAAGFDSGNYWWTSSPDLETLWRFATGGAAIAPGDLPGLFVTVTTLKDPFKSDGRLHTLEALTFVDYEAFRAFAMSRTEDRPDGYAALKRELQARMLAAVEHVVPGLRAHVAFAELGTPLTNEHYVGVTRGAAYGTEKSRWQVGPFGFGARSEIDGLSLCGASTLGHGVLGATLSGMQAAAALVGCGVDDFLRAKGGAPLRVYPADDPSGWPEALRRRLADRRRAKAAHRADAMLAAGAAHGA
ncbi:MAG TPA: NAD(P)/FAD-dependent oxidoreductase [Myxococcota bacterium]|jgi:phytoene dehydrogenase-like protein|nr:NAD(P)/FAD-dependent oxidoreductase [Myxococcota bacterium]